MNSAGPSASASAATTNSSASAARGTSDFTPSSTQPPRRARARGVRRERVEQRPAARAARAPPAGAVLAGEGRQIGGLLLGVAPQADRARDGARGERRERDPHVAVRERLGEQHRGHRAALGHHPAELLGDAERA